jgi:hypothetical protein
MSESIAIVKKYYPKVKVIERVKCKSIPEIAAECGMAKNSLYAMLNGVYAFDEDNPKHSKAIGLLAERAQIIDAALKENKEISADIPRSKFYEKS